MHSLLNFGYCTTATVHHMPELIELFLVAECLRVVTKSCHLERHRCGCWAVVVRSCAAAKERSIGPLWRDRRRTLSGLRRLNRSSQGHVRGSTKAR